MIQGSSRKVRMIWHGPRVRRKVDRIMRMRLRQSGVFMRSQLKARIGTSGDPSGAGDWPRKQSGELYESIEYRVSSNSVILYSDAEHAEYLEEGTAKMSPRKLFRAIWAEMGDRVMRVLLRPIRGRS